MLLSSCMQTSTNKENVEQNRKSEFPIVGFVEDFIAAHPNFDNNDLTRQEADEDFLKSFTALSESINLIQNIPVKLNALNKDSNGNVMAQFQSWIKPYGFEFPSPIKEVYFDIVGKIDPKYVSILNEDSYYTINGKFIGRIENLDAFQTFLGNVPSVYTSKFSVRKDNIFDDKYEVSLGMMYFDIDSISNFDK